MAVSDSNPQVYDSKPTFFSNTLWQSKKKKMAKATSTRDIKMSIKTQIEVEDSAVIKSAPTSHKHTGEALRNTTIISSMKLCRAWILIRNQNHLLSRKQILNFAHPEHNTKVQGNKHKHV